MIRPESSGAAAHVQVSEVLLPIFLEGRAYRSGYGLGTLPPGKLLPTLVAPLVAAVVLLARRRWPGSILIVALLGLEIAAFARLPSIDPDAITRTTLTCCS